MPMMCGMRNLPMMIGANSIIQSTVKNIRVGSDIGKYFDRLYSETANIWFVIIF